MKTADTVRTALLACFQQIEVVGRELALSRSLLDRAMQALDSADDAAELLPRIDELLVRRLQGLREALPADARPAEAPRSGPFRFRMDASTKSAQVGERRIPLSEREFAVLELLWEEMPRPVSRNMLLERIFGKGKAQDGSAADWYIFQVRQKLRNAGCDDVEIRSVRGRGWVLELVGEMGAVSGRASDDGEIFPEDAAGDKLSPQSARRPARPR